MPIKACHDSPAMRTLLASFLAFATASAITLVSMPRSAGAATGVARCAMPDGSYAYTGSACSALGGEHVALPVEVQNRIRRERVHEAQLAGAPLVASGLLSGPAFASAPRPKGQGCATTPRQLAADLRVSMAQGDVNRIAESFDWAGMSHDRAIQVMSRLERLGGVALVDAEYFGAGPDGSAAAAGPGGTLQVVLDEAGEHRVADFDVRRDSGCYFLRHAWAA